MCRPFTSSACLFLTLIWVLSDQVLLSQDTPPRTNSLPNAPSALATISESRTVVPFPFGRFGLFSKQCQSLNQPARFPTPLLLQDRRTIEWCARSTSVVGFTLPKNIAFAPAKNAITRHTASDSEQLEHYIQHIPVAGPMFLRISQDPHITRVLRVVQPEF
jgi:hypothetical protein